MSRMSARVCDKVLAEVLCKRFAVQRPMVTILPLDWRWYLQHMGHDPVEVPATQRRGYDHVTVG